VSFKRFYLAVLAITAVNYAMMLFYSTPLLVDATNGLSPFDIRITGYTPEDARLYVTSITDAGRLFYLGTQSTLDTFFPALYTLSLILTIYQLAPRLPVLFLTPLAGMVFDYYENAAVREILRGTAPDPALVDMASLLTQLKYISIALSILLILWLWYRRQRGAQKPGA